MTTKSAPFSTSTISKFCTLKREHCHVHHGCNNDHHHCVSNEWSFVEHGWVPHIVPSFCGICSVVAARTGEEEGREAQEVLDPLATKKAFTSPLHRRLTHFPLAPRIRSPTPTSSLPLLSSKKSHSLPLGLPPILVRNQQAL